MRGFTLIELIVTVVIVSVLASMLFPMAEVARQRVKERELQNALVEIRDAIDAYHRAVAEGKVVSTLHKSGYPPSLRMLQDGVPDAATPAGGAKLYFLRRIPRDPLAVDPTLDNEATWGKRDYASSAEEPREGDDVFDVYSLSAGSGLNGVPYREW